MICLNLIKVDQMNLFAKVLLSITVVFATLLVAEQKTIYFSPLPMKSKKQTIEEFLPFVHYMETKLPYKVEFNYKKDYNDILNGFIDGSIDIAYLGPLPYTVLRSRYPHVKPIVSFKQPDGTNSYRCAISKFSKDTIDFDKPVTVALTQPLSTCGYYAVKKMLKKEFGLSLAKQRYDYTMSHTNALIGVVKGEYMIAGSSERLAKQHQSLGMEIIARSELLPTFALVVNTKTLSSQEIEQITETLLNIPKYEYQDWRSIFKNGFSPADAEAYDAIDLDCEVPKKGNML